MDIKLKSGEILNIKGSVAEGDATTASGLNSHAEGYNAQASGSYSHAEGYSGNHQALIASGYASHAEGEGTQSKGRNSHAEGEMGIAYERGAHVEGKTTKAYGMYTHAEGSETEAGYVDPTEGKVWGDQAVHAEGYQTKAIDRYTHAEGYGTIAGFNPEETRPNVEDESSAAYGTPNYDMASTAHAEGYLSKSFGFASHSEGRGTTASGSESHTEGLSSIASGAVAHAEGARTSSTGAASHSEGADTVASNNRAHAEGDHTTASGLYSHSEGNYTTAINNSEHAEGKYNISISGVTQHTVGIGTSSSAKKNAHLITNDGKHYIPGIGGYTGTETSLTDKKDLATAFNASAVWEKGSGTNSIQHKGSGVIAYGTNSVAEGTGSKTTSSFTISGAANAITYTTSTSHNLKVGNVVMYNDFIRIITRIPSDNSFTVNLTLSSTALSGVKITTLEGIAYGGSSHVEGGYNIASGDDSHSEGSYNIAYKRGSHAEGVYNYASGITSHAEGGSNTASGDYSHVEGTENVASGNYSHAEGKNTNATKSHAHAEGRYTNANGYYSHAEGNYTETNNYGEHAEGNYNVSNKASSTLGNAGNTAHSIGIGTLSNRKNAFEIMQNGDAYLYGVGGYGGKTISDAAKLQTVINDKQDRLVFGTNIKKILNKDLLVEPTIDLDITDLQTLKFSTPIAISEDTSGGTKYGAIYEEVTGGGIWVNVVGMSTNVFAQKMGIDTNEFSQFLQGNTSYTRIKYPSAQKSNWQNISTITSITWQGDYVYIIFEPFALIWIPIENTITLQAAEDIRAFSFPLTH